jgi:hypothetical protein
MLQRRRRDQLLQVRISEEALELFGRLPLVDDDHEPVRADPYPTS